MTWIIPNPRTNSRPRRQTPPDVGGGSSGNCSEVDCLTIAGLVSGGSVTLSYSIKDENGDLVAADIEIEWNATKEDVLAAFEAHPAIGEGNVSVMGGPWPQGAFHVIYKGRLKSKVIQWPVIADSLTGDGDSFRMHKASSADWQGYDDDNPEEDD